MSQGPMKGGTPVRHAHLPRLGREAYRGHAMVHWSLSLQDRFDGWLDAVMHAHLRELMLHTAVRYGFLVPVYCAMPEHIHLLATGLQLDSDQALGIAFLKRHLNAALATRYRARLQKQSYDNVLRQNDRERGAFETVAHYILENPVRAELTTRAEDWPHSGCVVPGYPEWRVFHADYWNAFWRVYAGRRVG